MSDYNYFPDWYIEPTVSLNTFRDVQSPHKASDEKLKKMSY